MITPKFTGIIEKGKLTLDNKSKFELYLKCLDGRVELAVKKYRKARSIKQNSYYWLCVSLIAKEIGEEPEDLHATFKAMFLTDRTGKIPIVRSTTKLSTLQFIEYIEKITRKMAEIGIVLPNPDEISIDDIN